MSNMVQSWVADGGPQNTVQRYVLKEIADFANEAGMAFPGIALLAERTVQTERNVIRVLKALEAEGWLHIERKSKLVGTTGGHERMFNVYHLNVERLQRCADQVRVAREMRKRGVPSRDRVSPEPFTYSTKQTTYVAPHDSLSRELMTVQDVRDANDLVEAMFVQKPVDKPVNLSPRSDNGDSPDMTFERSDMTNGAFRGDKSGLLIRKNLKNQVQPPVKTETAKGGNDSQLLQRWSKIVQALKSDLATVTRRRGHQPVRPDTDDFEACFRDWWLVQIEAEVRVWRFITCAADVPATRDGVTAHASLLTNLIRIYFPVARHALVEILVRDTEQTTNPSA